MKEAFDEGDISPQRIETARNLSDCMTKALNSSEIEDLIYDALLLLGVRPLVYDGDSA